MSTTETITLKTAAENRALAGQNNPIFIEANLNLVSIRTKLESILNNIGRNGLFSEYTKHDITHIDGVLRLLDHIILPTTSSKLTDAEWMLIVLSVYFHDFGLLVTEEEFSTRNDNPEYNKYVREKRLKPGDEKKERKNYENFVRIHHGDRIYDWIMRMKTDDSTPCQLLNGMLGQLSEEFLECLALICRSHQEDVLPDKLFITDKQFAQDDSTRANLLYCAIAVRTGDLLHINSERTPLIDYRIINPQDPKSQVEWLKQRAIQSVLPRKEKPTDELRKAVVPQHVFEIQGTFKKPDAYFEFCEYCKYASKQLKISKQWCINNHPEGDNPYEFPWDDVDVSRVETVDFHREKLRFEVDKENILKLLTGHTLYNKSTVVIRELIQNALDAGRCQLAQSKRGDPYRPKVEILWDSSKRILSVSDNGTGMTMDTIKNYLLKVGVSKYQSEEFKNEFPTFHSISRFGIGLLTCFMISDDIDIYTLEKKEKICRHLMIRNLVGEYLICENDGVDRILEEEHGTTVELLVRQTIQMDDLESVLKEWVLIPGVEVTLAIDDKQPVRIGYESVKECLEAHLTGLPLGDQNQTRYEVFLISDDGMEVAILMEHDPYRDIWDFVRVDNTEIKGSPYGLAIEGIRVTKTTPGFNNSPFFIMANFTGKESPTTNVARDDIEQNYQSGQAYKKLYNVYINRYESLVKNYSDRYSLAWAAREFSYLIDSFLYRGRTISLSDPAKFEECMSDGDFLMIDDGNKYSMLSFNKLGDSIYTIGGNGYQSANLLLLDCNTSSVSALSVLRRLQGTLAVKDGRYLFIKNLPQVLKNLFFHKYSIDEIHIDKEHRQTIIRWVKEPTTWKQITMESQIRLRFDSSYRRFVGKEAFMPLDPGSVKVYGDEGEIAIKTSIGLVFNPNSSLIKGLADFMGNYRWTESREEKVFGVIPFFMTNEEYSVDVFNEHFNLVDDCSWSIDEKSTLESLFSRADYKICDFSYMYRSDF